MTTISSIMTEAAESFMHAGIPTPQLDARILMKHSLGINPEDLISLGAKRLNDNEIKKYREYISRRLKREPIAYITGKKEFWSLEFNVTSATLVPRPDSETLVEAVIADFPRGKSIKILDLGTGTGCLIISILTELSNASGLGVDLSSEALKIAKENAEKHNVSNRIQFQKSDWAKDVSGQFDVVISNPPYIPTKEITVLEKEVREFEPRAALDGGKEGLDCYQNIIPQLNHLLSENGLAYFEIGSGQEEDIQKISEQNSFKLAKIVKDLSGTKRVVVLKK